MTLEPVRSKNMHSGMATHEATRRFAHGFDKAPGYYRAAQDLTLSSLGIGTYLGAMDDATDCAYTAAVERAVAGGINVIDTSLNYRHQRSERAIGTALRGLEREALLVCTKAGFLVSGAVPEGLDAGEVAGGLHSMAPLFLRDQLERSRRNLGVGAVDVFYLHNPETQLKHVSREVFRDRCRAAFAALEELGGEGKLRWYGTATWDGYRRGDLSLMELADWARDIGASERTVARLFREALGMSYQQWRQQAILAHALPLLARGTPVSQVAAASGYASDSAFTAMFKAAMGEPPSTFLGRGPV